MTDAVKTISILGCGWLGSPLTKSLIKLGYEVKGSTTRKEKLPLIEQLGAGPHLVTVTPDECTGAGDFFNSDLLIVDFPPKRMANIETVYPQQMARCMERAIQGNVKFVIFTSSTSVYANCNGEVSEAQVPLPEKASGKALVAAEEVLQNTDVPSCILRFAGLIGPDRNPVNSILQRKSIIEGNTPVNLIHQSDCIGIILLVVEQVKEQREQQHTRSTVYNACAPLHPTRRAFYTRAAQQQQLPTPQFADTLNPGFKIVKSDLLTEALDYSFIYPDPLLMF